MSCSSAWQFLAASAPRSAHGVHLTPLEAMTPRQQLLGPPGKVLHRLPPHWRQCLGQQAAGRVGELHERIADFERLYSEHEALKILAGLGFSNNTVPMERATKDMSGGWRMRVALAAGLFSAPDFLLLDEPTNHLDLEATIWLEGFLARYPNGLLLVSHDRDLLNRVADGILHLEGQSLTYYAGNFERFERTRREKLAHQQAMFERQEAERKHIQNFVDNSLS